jgi:hypothetical protein
MIELGWLGIKLINKKKKFNKAKMRVFRSKNNNPKMIVIKVNHKAALKTKINQVVEAVMTNN